MKIKRTSLGKLVLAFVLSFSLILSVPLNAFGAGAESVEQNSAEESAIDLADDTVKIDENEEDLSEKPLENENQGDSSKSEEIGEQNTTSDVENSVEVNGASEPVLDNEPEEGQAVEGPENSWRYVDGELVGSTSTNALSRMARSGSVTWTKKNGVYTFSNGLKVDDAVAIGIDVSYHNGKIDWAKVKGAGVDFAIIRCGFGQDLTSQDDKQFLNNVKGCQKNGIPFGIYLYSYAYTKAMAQGEADHVLRLLDEAGLGPGDLAYPVYYDLEEQAGTEEPCVEDDKGKLHYISNTTLANMSSAFCGALEDEGYTAGIYANKNWWENFLTSSKFDNWDRWVAQYNDSGCTYKGEYSIWQLTSDGKVAGCTGNNGRVDLNLQFKEFDAGRLIKDSKGTRFLKNDGTYAKNEWVDYRGERYWFKDNTYALAGGKGVVDGKTYYFNADGSVRTGWVTWAADGRKSYFAASANGAAALGWWTIGGERYYFDTDKKAVTGEQTINGKLYFFLNSGQMYCGWVYWSEAKGGGRSYFVSGSGTTARGWWTIGGKKYYFSYGERAKALVGEHIISGKRYYFLNDGSRYAGWVYWKAGSRSYFASSASGAAAKGWWTIGGKRYYFDSSTARAFLGKNKISGYTYYFTTDGVMYKGWVKWTSDGKWSYFGSNGRMCIGVWTIGGKKYNFGTDGRTSR